ncbi:HAD-IA family hydrolase [Chitinophagaceae bacterium MMS25-I14]
MIQGIRHIIFDLGGVLLNIDYHLTEKAFYEAGITNFGELYSQLQQTSLFDDLETGKAGRKAFVDAMQEISGNKLSETQVIHAWNAMLLDFPLRRLQLLQQLRNHYDLFLLSNTNEIHEEAFNRILAESHNISNIGHFFDRAYLSHRIGMRKPSKEVFLHILEENYLQPRHTLFIDDSPQHIEGAKSAGLQTIWLEKGMTIEEHIFKPVTK